MTRLLTALCMTLLLVACDQEPHSHDHDHDHDHDHGHDHGHAAPHGGTLVVVGQEAAHLEFKLAQDGTMTCWILDSHVKDGVRIKQAEIKVKVTIGEAEHELVLAAVSDKLTGEKPGDSAKFEGKLDALAGVKAFDASIAEVEIKGAAYKAVAFPFPAGNDAHNH